MVDDAKAEDDQAENLAELSANLMDLSTRAQEVFREFLSQQSAQAVVTPPDPLNIGQSFLELTARMLAEPSRIAETQLAMWQDYMRLWQSATLKMLGEETEDVITEEPGDKRFQDEDWRDNQIFNFIKQSYLITSKYTHAAVNTVEDLPAKDRAKIDFYTKQFVDAMSPTNFVMTNPAVLRTTVEEKGENLVRGFENLLEDLDRGHGQLNIRMTDLDAFEVGENVAITPGKVVFRNRMFELIQYAPTTETVYKTPLLIFPPWINKFYILDLTAKKSFVRWAVEQGITVFMVSWVNPDGSYADVTFENYILEGLIPALEAVEKATGERAVHTVGYCVAGTMMSAGLAYLEAKGEADRVKSTTFFTAQIDFTEAGDLQIFVDEKQLEAIDAQMEEKGYLDASIMATTFNMLRSNDLIWSFVVSNYLMGKEPFPFDLLYWNCDATRLPRAMHQYYLKNMYLENRLVKPGELSIGDVPIDLTTVRTPMYIQAGRTDHIAPYASVYKMTHHFKGPMKFVLAGSGHIAGVVNPPSAKKYQYWLNSKKPKNVEEWVAGAEEHPGSWWPDWKSWLARRSGKKVPARIPGDGKLKALEDAPGSYVKVKSS
ncbi:MAG: class I poly(R)-hydroxyalkanoic acid synthase [Pseudomonadota bacterium]